MRSVRHVLITLCGLGLGTPATAKAAEATLNACSRSLSLRYGSAVLNGMPLWAYFTTYDGSSGIPWYDLDWNDYIIVSNELRLHAPATGEYRADYFLFADDTLDSTGTASVRFPTADTDRNGVPDFLQKEKAGTFSFTGSVLRQIPQVVGPMSLTGQITREADSTKGMYAVSIRDPAAGLVTYHGDVFILNASGKIRYDRATNSLEVEATVTSETGSSLTYTATSPFTVSDANTLRFPAMPLTGADGRLLKTRPFTLKRTGTRYLGAFEFEDGGVSTSWPDYVGWHLELTDPNDRDRDGIPDLSDTYVSPPVIATHPQGRSVVAGESVRMEVAASGPPPLTYQWRHNGQDIPKATASHFTLPEAQPADAGDYTVVVRNNGGQITSETARLTVSPPIPFRMDTPTVLTRGDIELRIHTTPGRRYQIQTSQDLKTWTNTGTAVTATGVTTVTRIPKSTAPRQFLRTRQLPNP